MKSRWLKKAMAAFLAVLMTVCALPVAAFVPETVESGEEFIVAEENAVLSAVNINDGSVFVKQATNYTCTLASAVMLVRRRAIVKGNSNWANITESAMRGTAWLEGTGLYNTFTYAGVTVNSTTSFSAGKKQTIINYLQGRPEGIVVYDFSIPHAVLITDYDSATDTFYCADPANGAASGRIPFANATTKGSGQEGKINEIDKIWYVKDTTEYTFTITYNANGGTGAPGNQTKTHGQSLTLSSVKPTKDGYTFQGWSTTLNGSVQYNPGSAYTGNANLTLYAVWNPVKYPIYFNANGGTGAPGTQYQTHFEYLTLSSVVPKKDGYTFKGWSTTLNGTVAYQPGGQFGENRSVTLYAVWAVIPVTPITLNQTTASLKKGETLTLTATVAPSDAANKSVTWSSGNTSVATVSTSGVVTAVGEGTAVITVKTADGGKTATCTVTVAHTHNYTGTYYETAHPHKAYSKCSCGEINYTGATQKVASCTSCYPVTGVTLDQTTATLKKGETLSLAVTVSPSDAANKAFTVTSSNPSVMSAKYRIGVCVGDLFDGSACTASHCEFTALSAGSTTLTFTTEDGQKTASCTVTATEPVVNAKAKFTLSEASGRPGDTVKITLSLKTEETVNSIAISGITYDKSIMTFTGFSDYEHIEDLTILPPTFDEEKMAIVIGLKNAAAFDGDICTLNFKINENALEGVTNIDASSVVKLKSAEIPSAVASGKVNIRLQTLGDIDGNDTVDIDDAVLLFQYSMLPELYPISYAGNLDFNKDGTVDIDDAVRLFQYSMLPDLYPLE